MEAICDRTASDISYAKTLLKKIEEQGFGSLDDTELYHWNQGLRGMLNYIDLNRIEGNCKSLLELFHLTGTTKTNWTVQDIPVQADFDRILSNVTVIRATNYRNQDTPSTPGHPVNTYQKVNNIEKILFDAYEMYNKNLGHEDYVEEIYADEGIGVI